MLIFPCTSYYPSVYLAMHCVGNKQRVFEALHPRSGIEEGLNHPNQYFQASLKHHEELKETEDRKSGKGKEVKEEEKAAADAGSDAMAIEPPAVAT